MKTRRKCSKFYTIWRQGENVLSLTWFEDKEKMFWVLHDIKTRRKCSKFDMTWRQGVYSPLPVYTEYLQVPWEHRMLHTPFLDWGRSEPSSAAHSSICLDAAQRISVNITMIINNALLILLNTGRVQTNHFQHYEDTITANVCNLVLCTWTCTCT